MNEYIKRKDAFEILQSRLDSISQMSYLNMDWHELDIMRDAIQNAIDDVGEVPAADVQPVDRWISVNDRLPEADYDCFVWYSCDTAFGKSKSWGIAHCSRCDWYTKHLDGDNIVVLYWMPCPEPPKDGDTNGY